MPVESRRPNAGEKTATAPVRGVSTRSPHTGAGQPVAWAAGSGRRTERSQ